MATDTDSIEAPAIRRALARPGALRALRLSAGHLNVSIANPITPEHLLAALLEEFPAGICDPRLRTFFDEIETATLADLVISGAITYRQLAKGAAIHLPETHETRKWLDERQAF